VNEILKEALRQLRNEKLEIETAIAAIENLAARSSHGDEDPTLAVQPATPNPSSPSAAPAKRRGRPRKSTRLKVAAPTPLASLSIPEAVEQILEESAGAPMRPMEIQKALMKAKVKLSKKFPQQQISRILNTHEQFKKVGNGWTLLGL